MHIVQNSLLRCALVMIAGVGSAVCAEDEKNTLNLPIANGPFKGTSESLSQYQYPEWFRDAKFGIWAHWGPQAVPMDGDWYARALYEEGSEKYQHHLEHFGHPSQPGKGYKDIIQQWKAEKWEPERLMSLYKKAGAKYFVSMGAHHDNFELWDSSKLHRWNSVQMGPHKDMVAIWAKAARKEGLRFGITEHMGHAFDFYQPAHGADKTGPFAGIPYDGNDPAYEDLYFWKAGPGEDGWYTSNKRFQQMWYDRITDLITRYDMDLFYSDGGVVFGQESPVGMSMIAHLYNTSIKNHGKLEAVYNCKQDSKGRWVEDLERGVMNSIKPYPWQCDTSIGDWYYNKNWKYRPVSWTIHMLTDCVSKNGNLLLNVVLRPDGSLDPEAEQQLAEMATWSDANGEAIYGTRPWQIYGEGAINSKGGGFQEDLTYSAKDIRFTTKGDTLYAIALGVPKDGKLRIRSLVKTAAGANAITTISLLGSTSAVKWTQNDDYLEVTLPENNSCTYTCSLKITGKNLTAVPVAFKAPKPDANGVLALDAGEGLDLHGEKLKIEQHDNKANVGWWSQGEDWVSWKAHFDGAGTYDISAEIATQSAGTQVQIEVGDQKFTAKIAGTTDWNTYAIAKLGTVTVHAAGDTTIAVRASDAKAWKPINLRSLTLTKTK